MATVTPTIESFFINPYIIPGIVEKLSINGIPVHIHNLAGLQPRNNTRRREYTIARQVGMAVAYVFSSQSLHSVGEMFERDHATVIHALKQMDRAVQTKDSYIIPLLSKAFCIYYNRYKRIREQRAILSEAERLEINIARERLNTYDFSRIMKHRFNEEMALN